MINIRKITLLISCFVCIHTNLNAQNLTEKIDKVMQEFIKLDQFSGTVLLAKNGNVLYKKAFGDANKSYNVKNTIDTKFNICSMGKMFTGVSIMQLEEQGKLQVNDPVIKHLKDFPFGDKITIHHLLTHTAGTGRFFSHPDYESKKSGMRNVKDMLPLVYEESLRFETPGEKFAYSNSGMIILGAIIEKISGKTYSDYIIENIFIPAKMNDTRMKLIDDIVENRALGYIKSISSKYLNNIFTIGSPSPAGGILSTVDDLLKFDQALYGAMLINEASKKKMFSSLKEEYGYAFQIENRYDNKIVGHGGGAPGFNSQFSRYLKDKYTLIVLSNYDRIAREVSYDIESIIYNKKFQMPKQRLALFIYNQKDKINSLNSSLDVANYLKNNNYKLRSSRYLNHIAYLLKHEEETDLSIKIFKLNVHLFPNNANGFDSLGEAYESQKKDDLALKNYEKAVEIATKNSDQSLKSFTATLERFKNREHK